MLPPIAWCTPLCGLNSSAVAEPARRCHDAAALFWPRGRVLPKASKSGLFMMRRHHRRADHVVGEPQAAGDAGPRMKQRIGVAVAGGERRRELPVGGPVPVRQREVGLARQFLADALEGADVGAVPRQEVPVGVRTEIAVDVGEADPVARIGLRQPFHRGDRAAHRGEIGIVGGHAANGAPRDARALRAERRIAPSSASDEPPATRNARLSSMQSPIPLMEKRYRMCAGKPIQRARMFPRVVIAAG